MDPVAMSLAAQMLRLRLGRGNGSKNVRYTFLTDGATT